MTSPAGVPGFVARAGGLVTPVSRMEESWPHGPHQWRRCPWKRDLNSVRSVLVWRCRNGRRPRSAIGSGRWRRPSAPCAASRSRLLCWCLMAARRAPTSAGTARTPSHARNAGPRAVRPDGHTRRRLRALPPQTPGNRRLTERRPSDWTACCSRQHPPCNQSRRSRARPCEGLPGLRLGNPQRVTRDRQDHGLDVPVPDQRAAGHGQERIAGAAFSFAVTVHRAAGTYSRVHGGNDRRVGYPGGVTCPPPLTLTWCGQVTAGRC